MCFGGGPAPIPDVTTQTQYVREAPEIEARKLGLMDTASTLATQGLTVPAQTVAGFDPQQQMAFDRQTAGLGAYAPHMQQAQALAGQTTGAYDPNAYKAFMNPHEDAVIKQIQEQFARQQGQLGSKAQQRGAYGGARHGLAESELYGQEAKTVGQARATGYTQAQQMAQSQFADQQKRLQAAAQFSAGLGQATQGLQAADVKGLMQTGTMQRQNKQMIEDAKFKQEMAQLYEPYQRTGFVSDIFQGAPTSASSLTASTAPGTNPLAQAMGAGLTGIAAYQGYQQSKTPQSKVS